MYNNYMSKISMIDMTNNSQKELIFDKNELEEMEWSKH
jgi:hypothetical protein